MSTNKQPPRQLVVVNSKVEPELLEKLKTLAKRKEWTVSQTLRHLIKSHFQKKAA